MATRRSTLAAALLAVALVAFEVRSASPQPSASCDSLTLEVAAPLLMRPGENFAVVVTNLDDEVHSVTVLVEGDIIPQTLNLTLGPGEQRYESVELATYREAGRVKLNVTLFEDGRALCQVRTTVTLATGTPMVTAVLYGAVILLAALFAYILILRKGLRRRSREGTS